MAEPPGRTAYHRDERHQSDRHDRRGQGRPPGFKQCFAPILRACPPKRSACRHEETPCVRFSPGEAFIDSPRPLLCPGGARTPACAPTARSRTAHARPGLESLAPPPPSRRHAVPLPSPSRATQTTDVGLIDARRRAKRPRRIVKESPAAHLSAGAFRGLFARPLTRTC